MDTDKHVFKVPSLRNIAKTAPYLHNGSIDTLEEMVQFMARHQLGKGISDEEIADIVAFLHTLTGEIPLDYIARPELPDMATARATTSDVESTNTPRATRTTNPGTTTPRATGTSSPRDR